MLTNQAPHCHASEPRIAINFDTAKVLEAQSCSDQTVRWVGGSVPISVNVREFNGVLELAQRHL